MNKMMLAQSSSKFNKKNRFLIYGIIFISICLYLFVERRPTPVLPNSEVSFEKNGVIC